MSDRPNTGPPPRQHKHTRQYTPSTHSVIPTMRIWNDDYDGQMIFGDLGGLKVLHICLTGEENARKNLTQETCPDRGSNPGPLRDKRACYHLLHSGGLLQNHSPIIKKFFLVDGITSYPFLSNESVVCPLNSQKMFKSSYDRSQFDWSPASN